MPSALIRTRNLCKSYFSGEVETPVLHDINVTIDRGELVAIVGPSGSGKSTLMHILGFLDAPTSGEYVFDEKSTTSFSDNDLARIRATRIGFVFQAFNLLPRMTVYDNVGLPLLYHPTIREVERRERIERAIAQVELSHRTNHRGNQLSGGEQQRTAIARSLVTGPDLIFADEPTGNLDSRTGTQVMEVFKRLNEEGHTIILVTHDKDIAAYAKRTIEIRDGRIS